jgi:hypothetical protein
MSAFESRCMLPGVYWLVLWRSFVQGEQVTGPVAMWLMRLHSDPLHVPPWGTAPPAEVVLAPRAWSRDYSQSLSATIGT